MTELTINQPEKIISEAQQKTILAFLFEIEEYATAAYKFQKKGAHILAQAYKEQTFATYSKLDSFIREEVKVSPQSDEARLSDFFSEIVAMPLENSKALVLAKTACTVKGFLAKVVKLLGEELGSPRFNDPEIMAFFNKLSEPCKLIELLPSNYQANVNEFAEAALVMSKYIEDPLKLFEAHTESEHAGQNDQVLKIAMAYSDDTYTVQS
jgi:hypothetical protein